MIFRSLDRIEKDSPAIYKAMALAGYHLSLRIASAGDPGSQTCVQCGTTAESHKYGSAWCDGCLRRAGFVPVDHEKTETRIMFRPFFDMLSNAGEWELLRKFVVFFESRRADIILAGKFTLDIQALVAGVEDNGIRCPECSLLVGPQRVKGFCSSKCYHKDYRRRNKEKLAHYQKTRREDSKL